MRRIWMMVLAWVFSLASAGSSLFGHGTQRAIPTPVPVEAMQILAHVRATGQALPGYEGGRRFGNYASDGEQKLPVTDALGSRIHYREWDIHPRLTGQDRGPERLVTGSDGRAWFTANHYGTFTEVQ